MHYEFQKYNPKRTPSWRFERIMEILDGSGPRKRTPHARNDDEYVKEAFVYIRKLRLAETEEAQHALFPDNPGLFYAYLIYQDEDREQRRTIEARLLAQQTDHEIADKVPTLPAAVEWYERLFFNVRDRIQARDWILKQIMGPAIDRMMEDRAAELNEKIFAYFMGPLMYEMLSSNGFLGIAHVGDPLELITSMDDKTGALVRLRAMTGIRTAEVNRYNIVELIGAQQRLLEITAAAKDDNEAKTAVEENIRVMMKEIPWLVGIGEKAKTAIGQTPLGQYESLAAELRADEMLAVAAGQEVPGIADLATKTLPAPRAVEDGTAQQGS